MRNNSFVFVLLLIALAILSWLFRLKPVEIVVLFLGFNVVWFSIEWHKNRK